MKTAQEIINEVDKEHKYKLSNEEFKKMFYPIIWEQEQASRNITKICKEVLI